MRRYSNNRQQRIADQIQKDVVTILRSKVKNPKITWVTVNDVEVTKDNSLAIIYWTTLDESKRKGIEKALEEARGFIRSELSKNFKTYTIPQLKFTYDESLKRGSKILSIINKLSEEFKDDENDEDDKEKN